MKKLARKRGIILVLILVLMAFVTKTYLLKRFEMGDFSQEDDDLNCEKIELSDTIFKEESIKVKKIAENISNEIEIIVLKEVGTFEIFHDRTPENNKYIEWVIDSNINIKIYYTAVLAIDTEYIDVIYDEFLDTINIIYDLQNIKVTAINIDDILISTNKGILGRKYSELETSSFILFATDKINKQILNNEGIKAIASINLQEYLRCVGYKLGIFNIKVVEK